MTTDPAPVPLFDRDSSTDDGIWSICFNNVLIATVDNASVIVPFLRPI